MGQGSKGGFREGVVQAMLLQHDMYLVTELA